MGINAFQLKWIAIITMLIDHTGAILYGDNSGIFRMIGRIAFPIFCFLLVEGFFHTKDVHRYMLRLALFALVSEIPYELAFYRRIFIPVQNVFFTLLIGMTLMYVLEKNKNIALQAAYVLLAMWGAYMLRTDYGYRGILLIVIFYYFYKHRAAAVTLAAGWNFLYGLGAVQNWGVLASPFLALYNGERGPKMRYFFYVFYPAHLLILYVIDMYVNGGRAFYIY